MGFLFANSTDASRALLGNMLLEKLDQLQLRHVKFYNDQRVLNEQLLLVSKRGLMAQGCVSCSASVCRPDMLPPVLAHHTHSGQHCRQRQHNRRWHEQPAPAQGGQPGSSAARQPRSRNWQQAQHSA
jgi:hypothetical protein